MLQAGRLGRLEVMLLHPARIGGSVDRSHAALADGNRLDGVLVIAAVNVERAHRDHSSRDPGPQKGWLRKRISMISPLSSKDQPSVRLLVILIRRRAMRPARCSRQLGPAVSRTGSAGRGGMCRSRPWSSSTRTARIPSRRNSGIPGSRERCRMTRKYLRPPRRGISNPDADAICQLASSLRPGTRTGRPAAARSWRRACWPAMTFSAWLLA